MKKKVLFIDNSPWWGGAEACLNTYTKDGSLKDFDVEICFLFPLEHQSQYEASKKTYRYSQCSYFMPEFYNRPIKGLDRLNKYLRAKKLKEILQKSKPDIVYLNLYRNRDIWDIKIIKEYGCKVVFHIRNLYHQAKYNIDILNQADLIIGTSKYVCDEIERHGYKNKIVNLYDSVNFQSIPIEYKSQIRSEYGFSQDDIIGVFPAIIDPRKGQDSAIKAFKKILRKHPNARLLIVGGCNKIFTDYENKLLDLMKGFEKNIFYLGHQKNINQIYRIADYVLALSHDGEAYGLVPIEAGLCKLPVIATNVGATPELIINAETGFLVEPKDINTVEIAISTMINDNILRKKMGDNGYKRITTIFTKDKCLDKLNEELNKLIC